jgi:hypothetical protein
MDRFTQTTFSITLYFKLKVKTIFSQSRFPNQNKMCSPLTSWGTDAMCFLAFKFDRLPSFDLFIECCQLFISSGFKTHSTRAFIIDIMFKMTGHLNSVIIIENQNLGN